MVDIFKVSSSVSRDDTKDHHILKLRICSFVAFVHLTLNTQFTFEEENIL